MKSYTGTPTYTQESGDTGVIFITEKQCWGTWYGWKVARKLFHHYQDSIFVGWMERLEKKFKIIVFQERIVKVAVNHLPFF